MPADGSIPVHVSPNRGNRGDVRQLLDYPLIAYVSRMEDVVYSGQKVQRSPVHKPVRIGYNPYQHLSYSSPYHAATLHHDLVGLRLSNGSKRVSSKVLSLIHNTFCWGPITAPSPWMGEDWDEGDTPHLSPLPSRGEDADH